MVKVVDVRGVSDRVMTVVLVYCGLLCAELD